jgi:hypothetical protein
VAPKGSRPRGGLLLPSTKRLRAHATTGHMPTCGGPSLPIALGSAWGELRWLFSHLIHFVSGQERTRLFPGQCSAYSKLHETDLEDASLRTCTAVRSHRPKHMHCPPCFGRPSTVGEGVPIFARFCTYQRLHSEGGSCLAVDSCTTASSAVLFDVFQCG